MEASRKFELRSHDHDSNSWWLSQDRRYYKNAKQLLAELLEISRAIKADWPVPNVETSNGNDFPHLLRMCEKRDILSDSVFIFSAMAVEGFINFYGVLRLGENCYNEFYERLPIAKKLKALLLVCDAREIDDNHQILMLLSGLSRKRNSLVHPKTKEFVDCVPASERNGAKIPADAERAVKDMEDFFSEFSRLVPEAQHLLPK